MKLNRQTFYFFAYYFLNFFAQAISYALLITFLTTLGYSATERSFFFVADALSGMILQVVLGYLCDRHQKIKPYLYLVMAIYMAGTFFLYRTTGQNFFLHMLLVASVGSMLRLLCSLSDSITIETSPETRDNYGVIRLFGSVGWAIGSPVAATIVEKFGYSYLGPAFLLFMGLSFLVILGINDVKKVKTSEPINVKDVGHLLGNRTYVITVIILFLFYVVDLTQSYSVVDKIWYLNGTEKDVGNYWLMAAMLEMPLFFFGGRLMKKFGANKLIVVAGIFYIIRYTIYGLATNITHMFIAGALQSVTYPLLMVTSKIMIDEQTPANMKTSGQQIANSIYASGSALVSPLMIGLLEDGIGINRSLFVIAAIAVVPTIMSILMGTRKSAKA